MDQVENKSSFHRPVLKPKDAAYNIAQEFRQKGDNKKAEDFALKAMKLGSENLAPQLLAEIAMEIQSKNIAMTLASYYYHEREDLGKALEWANLAVKFGSKNLAKELIAKIAHEQAVKLHETVLRY
jgi:phage shock protein A